jgi:hypothetical protein
MSNHHLNVAPAACLDRDTRSIAPFEHTRSGTVTLSGLAEIGLVVLREFSDLAVFG